MVWAGHNNVRLTRKHVFHQFEFVDKFNLGSSNPRRDTSIPSVSAGLFTAGNYTAHPTLHSTAGNYAAHTTLHSTAGNYAAQTTLHCTVQN